MGLCPLCDKEVEIAYMGKMKLYICYCIVGKTLDEILLEVKEKNIVMPNDVSLLPFQSFLKNIAKDNHEK